MYHYPYGSKILFHLKFHVKSLFVTYGSVKKELQIHQNVFHGNKTVSIVNAEMLLCLHCSNIDPLHRTERLFKTVFSEIKYFNNTDKALAHILVT